MHIHFQISPGMFNQVQVWPLAGPIKDINRVVLKPLLCYLGCVLRVIVFFQTWRLAFIHICKIVLRVAKLPRICVWIGPRICDSFKSHKQITVQNYKSWFMLVDHIVCICNDFEAYFSPLIYPMLLHNQQLKLLIQSRVGPCFHVYPQQKDSSDCSTFFQLSSFGELKCQM